MKKFHFFLLQIEKRHERIIPCSISVNFHFAISFNHSFQVVGINIKVRRKNQYFVVADIVVVVTAAVFVVALLRETLITKTQ